MDNVSSALIAYWKLIHEITDGDEHAIHFIAQANAASEVYRKADQGLALDRELIKESIVHLGSQWLINPFVQKYASILAPVLMGCLERYTNESDLKYCPVDVDLITTVCVIYGKDVQKYMPKIRELSDILLKERKEKEE